MNPARSTLVVVAAFVLVTGCASSPMMRAARNGDHAALSSAILAADAKGKLTLDEAASLAKAVVVRELTTAKTDAEARARIKDIRSCAFAVDDVLAERMKTEDAVGGEAALVRVETGALSEASARGHIASTDDRWRAVGMWGMTRDRDDATRQTGLTDGSLVVRKAALHALVEHDDPRDIDALLGAARSDPDPILRGMAIRALRRMHGAPDDLSLRLRDLFTSGDELAREDIAALFASAALDRKGGHEALAHLLLTTSGNEAVMLAGVILGADVDDAALRATAVTLLASALREGGHRARIHALVVVPLGKKTMPGTLARTLLDAVKAAVDDADLDVREAALGRLVDPRAGLETKDWTAAVRDLENMAAPTPDDASPTRSSRARLLLAEAGDLRMQAWLEADARSKDADAKISAAHALAAIGRASRAASLLADEDPSVRSQAACVILLAARHPVVR